MDSSWTGTEHGMGCLTPWGCCGGAAEGTAAIRRLPNRWPGSMLRGTSISWRQPAGTRASAAAPLAGACRPATPQRPVGLWSWLDLSCMWKPVQSDVLMAQMHQSLHIRPWSNKAGSVLHAAVLVRRLLFRAFAQRAYMHVSTDIYIDSVSFRHWTMCSWVSACKPCRGASRPARTRGCRPRRLCLTSSSTRACRPSPASAPAGCWDGAWSAILRRSSGDAAYVVLCCRGAQKSSMSSFDCPQLSISPRVEVHICSF